MLLKPSENTLIKKVLEIKQKSIQFNNSIFFSVDIVNISKKKKKKKVNEQSGAYKRWLASTGPLGTRR